MSDKKTSAICLDLGAFHWRVGRCGDLKPWLDTATDHAAKYISDEQLAAHPLIGVNDPEPEGVPGLARANPMVLINKVRAQAIVNAPGARKCLWELHCEMLEGALREAYFTSASRDVVCTLPLFTQRDSTAMTERLRIIFGDSGPFRRAGWEVERLLFAHPEILALYSCGRTVGLSVSLGSNITILPVYEGYAIASGARRHPWPGDDEVLLPHLVSLIIEALEACPPDTQHHLAEHILISGKTSLQLEELRCRGSPIKVRGSTTDLALWDLQEALKETGRRSDYRLNLPPDRAHSAWIGGSILGILSKTPWEAESWFAEKHGGLRIDSAHYCSDHRCYWPNVPQSLVLDFDKSDATAFAVRLLAWGKAMLWCANLDDSFDVEVVDKIGTEARRVWEASSRSLRGPVMQSDADELVPIPSMVLHRRMGLGSAASHVRQPMSSLEPTGPGIGSVDSHGETWQDLWTALAVADNDVPDCSGQLHRPPDALLAMQQAGLHPVRSVVWLLYGQNWYGNMMHHFVPGLYTSDETEEEPAAERAEEGDPPPPSLPAS